MAAPSYTTDLTMVDDGDAITGWAESSDSNWDDGRNLASDADYAFIQGLTAAGQQFTVVGVASCIYNNGSGITIPTDGAYLVWLVFTTPTALDTYANGGLRVIVGSGLGDFKSWDVGGSDVYPNPYGGFKNYAVNPTETADDTVGTPTSTEQYIGGACKSLVGISKGQPFMVDAIRYGRCEARMNGGDVTNGYATFAGFATENDKNQSGAYNRWGLLQDISSGAGVFLWKGLMRLGYSSAVDFRDSDVTILVDDTPKCTANFNKIDVEQSGSNVEWTNITIIALGTQSKGRFEAVADATIVMDGCKFVDMDTFIFDSNSDVDDTVFQRCGQVTVGGGDFDGCLFEESTAASAVSAATPAEAALIVNSDFVSDGTGHGITIGGTAANITLDNVTFSGYAASDGSSGDEAIYVNIATGSMNITVDGAAPSIRTAGCVVTVITSARTVKVTAKTSGGTEIQNANVFLRTKTGGTGPFPNNATVTINNSGNTATVTHTAHGMASNDYVLIEGADYDANNGVFQITYISSSSYSYTMASSPGDGAVGGTIKCWFVFLKGLTDVNGEIEMSRSIPSNQDVEGWSAKASGTPYYKNGVINGVVSSSGDTSFNAVMVLDE
jgi:hypothetical protein